MKVKIFTVYSTDSYESLDMLYPSSEDWEEISEDGFLSLREAVDRENSRRTKNGRRWEWPNKRLVLITYDEDSTHKVWNSYKAFIKEQKELEAKAELQAKAAAEEKKKKALERKKKQLEKLKKELGDD